MTPPFSEALSTSRTSGCVNPGTASPTSMIAQPRPIWIHSSRKYRRLSVQRALSRSQLTLMMSVEMRAQASSRPSSVVSRMATPIHRKKCWKAPPYARPMNSPCSLMKPMPCSSPGAWRVVAYAISDSIISETTDSR